MKIADFPVLMINPHPAVVCSKWFASLNEGGGERGRICRLRINSGPTDQQSHHDEPKKGQCQYQGGVSYNSCDLFPPDP